jgi:SPW repeat-containing protein
MLTLTRDYAAQARTASGINILLGIWLIVSPWVFDYSGRAPVLNSVYVGAVIAMLAAFRLATLRRSAGLSAINVILALWVIASPWVYGYSANVGAVGDNLLLGIAIATLASWSGSATMFGQNHPPGTPAR